MADPFLASMPIEYTQLLSHYIEPSSLVNFYAKDGRLIYERVKQFCLSLRTISLYPKPLSNAFLTSFKNSF